MPKHRLKTTKLFGLLNLIGFVLVLGINYLANSLPLNGYQTGEISDYYPNLFVPAGRTFAIWGLIYLLMAGFIIAPFISEKNREKIQQFGWYYSLSCLANTGWLLCWHYRLMVGSLLCMLTLLAVLVQMYRRLDSGNSAAPWPQNIWIKGFISIYLAWISVATIANVTTVLIHEGWSGWGFEPVIWTVVVLCVASALGGWFVWKYLDLAYAGVIVWALYGISSKQADTGGPVLIINLSQVFMVILILFGTGIVIKKRWFV